MGLLLLFSMVLLLMLLVLAFKEISKTAIYVWFYLAALWVLVSTLTLLMI